MEGSKAGDPGQAAGGVIKPSASLWHGPIVLMPRPDSSLWICLDFRAVNWVSVLMPTPSLTGLPE